MNTGRSRTQSSPFVPPAERNYLLVGITGGIGSGKSALCEAFASLGRLVISADLVARDLTANDPAVREEIRTAFGPDIITPEATLDRKALARIVFHDRKSRERLNAIVHPRVFAALTRQLAEEPPSRLQPYTIVEAALIFESGMTLDYVIVVDAPEEERIRRVMLRDGAGREEVLSRIASQMSAAEKRRRADFVVENIGPADALASRTTFLDTVLRSLPRRV